MADIIDPEQIKDLNEALKNLTDTVDGLSGAHRKTTTGLTAGIKEFTGITDQQANALSKLLTGLGTTVAGQTKAMYKGQQGAEVLAGSFDVLGDAVFAVIALINPLGAAATFVAKKLIGLAVDYGKAAAKQADQEYKAYQDLSRAGAATAGGLGDVLTSVQKFGYGLDEVDKMTKLIAENSESLAKFGITAAGGATAFGDAMNQLTHGETGQQLRELGKTTDDINTAGAAYIKQQVLQGRTQKDVNDNLAGSTKQYITDLDKLQRLTGTSAEALQKQQEEKYADSAYAAWIDRMKSGTVEQQAQAALVEKKIDALNAASPELGKLARRGLVDPSAQGMISQMAPALMDLATNTDDVATTMEKTSGQIKQFQKNMGGLYEVSASGMDEQYINYSKLSQSAAGLADWHEKEAKAAADAAAPKDQALKNQVTIQQAEMDARDKLQSFVQFGVIPATNALKGIANIYKGGTGMLPGSPASGGAGGQGPGGGVADLQKQLGIGAAAGAGYKGPAGALQGVNAQLADALQKATTEYKQVTGKTATITSGVRDREKQERMYNEWVAGGKKGRPVAKPGHSLHETGNAVDVDTSAANEMDRLGILKKYGLDRPVAGDPVHIQLANAGPNSGYQSQMAGVNPSKSLPIANASTPTAALPIAGDDQHADLLSQINSQLARLNSSNDAIAGHTKKSVQLQS